MGLRPNSVFRTTSTTRPSGTLELPTSPDPVIPPTDSGLKLGQYDMDGFVYGTRSRFAVPNDFLVNSFDIEQGEIDTVDSGMPWEDGTVFGIDLRGGQTISQRIYLWRRGQPALDDLGKIRRAWRGDSHRLSSNKVTTLKMNKQGRVRMVYGRPRRFKPEFGAVERGWCPIDVDFKCVDEVFWDYEQSAKTIQMASAPTNGLTLPTVLPATISQFEANSGSFIVTGDLPTWPVFVIEGPVINPYVEIVGQFHFSMNVSLLHTDRLTIDTRPWQRTVLLNGEINRSGRFTADSQTLPRMKIYPGQRSIRYRGVDATLSSRVTIGWRNAFATP